MSDLIQGKPQLPPGMCFICELSNPVRYVDTFRNFEGIGREKLDGRKYLCEECVADGAKKLGYATPKKYEQVRADWHAAEEHVSRLEEKLKAFEDIRDAVTVLAK